MLKYWFKFAKYNSEIHFLNSKYIDDAHILSHTGL